MAATLSRGREGGVQPGRDGAPERLAGAGEEGHVAGAQVLELGVRNASIHQINEHVAVADLEPLAQVYEQILAGLL